MMTRLARILDLKTLVKALAGLYIGIIIFFSILALYDVFANQGQNIAQHQAETQPVDAVLSLVELSLGLVAFLLPLALGLMIYIYRQAQNELEVLRSELRKDFNTTKAQVQESVEELRKDLRTKTKRSIKQLRKQLKGEIDNAQFFIQLVQKETKENVKLSENNLKKIKTAEDSIEQTLSFLNRYEEFLTVQNHAMRLVSNDNMQVNIGLSYLLDRRYHADALIRHEAVRNLGRFIDSPLFEKKYDAVYAHLQRIVEGGDIDEEEAIRLQAERVIKKLAAEKEQRASSNS